MGRAVGSWVGLQGECRLACLGSASCPAAAAPLRAIGLGSRRPHFPAAFERAQQTSSRSALRPASPLASFPWPCPPPSMCLLPPPPTAPGGPSQVMVVSATTCRNMQGGTKPGTHGTFQKQAWHAGAGKGFKQQESVWKMWISHFHIQHLAFHFISLLAGVISSTFLRVFYITLPCSTVLHQSVSPGAQQCQVRKGFKTTRRGPQRGTAG